MTLSPPEGCRIDLGPLKIDDFTTFPADQVVVALVSHLEPGLAFHCVHFLNQAVQVEGGQSAVDGVQPIFVGFFYDPRDSRYWPLPEADSDDL